MSPRPEGVFLARAIPPKPAQGGSVERLVCPLCHHGYRRTPTRVPEGCCTWCGRANVAHDPPSPHNPGQHTVVPPNESQERQDRP